MRTEVPNPCSLFDEWLRLNENDLGPDTQLTLEQLQRAVRNVVSALRAQERERVMKIMDRI